MKIIINADDFGINKSVTVEIEKRIINKAISSTTIMANGDCLEEVKRFIPLHPEISFGAHLCLSEYASLTKSDELRVAGLTDEQGVFIKGAIFKVKQRSELLTAIEEELNAQLDVISPLNSSISHVDSHHHVHTIPWLQNSFIKVLKDRGIHRIRLGHEFVSLRNKMHIYQWIIQKRTNKLYSSRFVTTKAFMSYSEFVIYYKKYMGDNTIELMCHPGHPGLFYKKELELIDSFALNKLCDFNLVNYNDFTGE